MNLAQTATLSAMLATSGILGIFYPQYKQPSPDTPGATLHFRDADIAPQHHNASFVVVDDAVCGITKGHGFITSVGPIIRRQHDARTVAGKPLFLMAQSYIHVGGLWEYCTNLSSFTPETGHTYEVWQNAAPGKCAMMIRDQATSQPPSTLEKLKVDKACKLS